MTAGHDTTAQSHFWTSSDLDGLELLWGRFKRQVYRPHVHEGYALCVVTRGAKKCGCRQKVHIAGPGDIIIINPDSPHDGESGADGGWQCRVMYPRERAFAQLRRQMGGNHGHPPRFSNGLIRDPFLAHRLVRLHQMLERPASTLQCQSLWTSAIGRLIGLHSELPVEEGKFGNERPGVQRVKEFLASNLSKNVTLNDAARVARLSPYYLQRIFKRETGVSPHEFLTNVRARHAKQLLQDGEPIAQVATASGFVDQAHLTKCFKAIFGVTPGQYCTAIRQL